ncbi:MAG: SDR family oxidoreductase [Herpetosiphon sp.]
MSHSHQRTALVTGASEGLGLALSAALAQDGWRLIIDARREPLLAAARDRLAEKTLVVALVGDVTDPDHRAALATAASAAGGLDLLINNASLLGPSPQPLLLDYPLPILETVFRVNVISPLAVIQAVQSSMKPKAVVINISSDAAVEAYAGWGGYGASKAALDHLTAILAVEHPNWRVYAVDPGDMQTTMHQSAFPDEDISDRPLPDVIVPHLLGLIAGDLPSGRYQARTLPPCSPTVNEARTNGKK